jgi:hypothetical protein
MKRILGILSVVLLVIACHHGQPELKTLRLQVGQSVALRNRNNPSATFVLQYVVNRPAPLFNDVFISYEWVNDEGPQHNQTLAECDFFPCEGILGPGDREVQFQLPYTGYPTYVVVNFPPGWYISQ